MRRPTRRRYVASALLVGILTSGGAFAESPDIQLGAKLDRQAGQIDVWLRRNGGRQLETTYLLYLGELCGQESTPRFEFTLHRKGLPGQKLVLLHTDNSKVDLNCAHPLPWVTALPTDAQYQLSFTLSDLHIGARSGVSLSSIKEEYEIQITYSAAVTDDFAAKWHQYEMPMLPFWTKSLNIIIR